MQLLMTEKHHQASQRGVVTMYAVSNCDPKTKLFKVVKRAKFDSSVQTGTGNNKKTEVYFNGGRLHRRRKNNDHRAVLIVTANIWWRSRTILASAADDKKWKLVIRKYKFLSNRL